MESFLLRLVMVALAACAVGGALAGTLVLIRKLQIHMGTKEGRGAGESGVARHL